jgi:hypothetical protein
MKSQGNICVHDVYASIFFSFVCHDTVSYYDTTLTSIFTNCCATSDFYQYGIHNTSYDTSIVSSLRGQWSQHLTCIY